MAAELSRFIQEQLARLPEDHLDRSFLTGLQATVEAYTRRAGPPAVDPEAIWHPPTEPERLPASPTEPRETQQRVRFTGYIGLTPEFRPTPKGRFLLRLVVAEHVEGEERARWRHVFAFDERARKLQKKGLAIGDAVEIIGYKHERQVKGRDGTTRTLEDIYAVAVKTRGVARG
jgi:hypothetical protein